MFTGLIEHMGLVRDVRPAAAGRRIEIDAGPVADGTRIGDSIAVDGACLTVVLVQGARLAFEAGPETLSRTTLGDLGVGSQVNLERALAVGDRLGGHFVQGHVDGVAAIRDRQRERQWELFRFAAKRDLTDQMVSKGSVAVAGVSLTLVDVGDGGFNVALIPHTLANTTLHVKRAGDAVNIEVDILGKYVKRFLEHQRQPGPEGVTMDLLRRAGFD